MSELAEGAWLEIMCTVITVPGVRIPVSPPKNRVNCLFMRFFLFAVFIFTVVKSNVIEAHLKTVATRLLQIFFKKNALGSYCPRADFMPFLKSHCIMFLPLGWYSDLYQPKNPCAPSGLWCPLAALLRRSCASRMFCDSYEGLNLRESREWK